MSFPVTYFPMNSELLSPLRHLFVNEHGKYQGPKGLFIQGSPRARLLLNELPRRALAVVGTRRAQHRSLALVERVLGAIAPVEPLIIVSGLARGIDARAHEVALSLGLPTIAFLGGGHDPIYPEEHEMLRRRILKADGLVISEYDSGMKPQPGFFLRRNRLIARFSQATWVVEAGYRSGALNTAKEARDASRPVYATVAFPGDPAFAGNEKLIESHNPPARTLYSARSLAVEWLTLSSAPGPTNTPKGQNKGESDPVALTPLAKMADHVHREQKARGGITISQLLGWGVTPNGSQDQPVFADPSAFFETLQQAVELGLIIQENGLLLKKLDLSR